MDAARREKWIGFLCLGVTAFGWALNWPLMKLLLQEWPPLFARGLAGVAASLILAAIALGRGQSFKVPREAIPRLLFASFTNVFAWMGFGTMAMKFVTVGEGALLVYTMPIWAMLFAWPVGIGCLAMLILGVVFERPNFAAISPLGIACFIYMTLVPMGICYITWFETLRRLPPASASTGMLLVPVIGVVSAAIILGEPLGMREVAAMALTLGGVTLALRRS